MSSFLTSARRVSDFCCVVLLHNCSQVRLCKFVFREEKMVKFPTLTVEIFQNEASKKADEPLRNLSKWKPEAVTIRNTITV